MIEYKIPKSSQDGIPFYFRLAQAWNSLFPNRGGGLLYRILLKLGLLNKVAKFNYFKKGIYIPLDISYTLTNNDFSLFNGLREVNFANYIYRNLDDFVLIDCGAAFGQVSMRLANICSKLKSIIAIDPNRSHCEVLKRNLALTDIDFQVIHSAVSDFTGNGQLHFPNGEHDTHSAYITRNDTGPIKVCKLDDIVNTKLTDVALKLDVEGHEINVINGAKRIITEADSICFFVEIHPVVLERNKEKGEDILKTISSIRQIKWCLAENPQHEIDENKPFFSQVKETRQYDVIGVSV